MNANANGIELREFWLQFQLSETVHLICFFLQFPFILSSGIRQQNDSLLMIYYHDQAIAIGEHISMT